MIVTTFSWHRSRVLHGWLVCSLCLAGLVVLPASRADFQGSTHIMPFEEDAIQYGKAKDTGPIARLQERIDQDQVQLRYDSDFGFLLDLLKELNIPPSSQMLVFSKTSLQRERISPHTPRALYFSDDAYIGFIPGSPMLEMSAVDPKLGAVFYTLEQKPAAKPKFVRTDQCLECHASSKSMGVPGHLVRSFVTDERGIVDLVSGISPVNHRTPLSDRWGGWYVSGTHGDQTHRGNLIGKAAFARQEKEPNWKGNVTDLSEFFAPARYPNSHSDIVALMVFEHQTHMHNFLTRMHYAATIALNQYGHVNYLNSVIEAFLKYLLFVEEVPLTAPIRGTSGFAESFATQGPKDKYGRSLRQLNLQTRLFEYPCSYLVYSDAFKQLPDPLKDRIYKRLWEVLTGTGKNSDFAKIPPEVRQVLQEILADTLPDLPDYWSKSE